MTLLYLGKICLSCGGEISPSISPTLKRKNISHNSSTYFRTWSINAYEQMSDFFACVYWARSQPNSWTLIIGFIRQHAHRSHLSISQKSVIKGHGYEKHELPDSLARQCEFKVQNTLMRALLACPQDHQKPSGLRPSGFWSSLGQPTKPSSKCFVP